MWRRTLLAVLGICFVCAAAAAALPDNEYQRWQLLAHTSQRRVLWLYQRLHYDPTPVDVALIGTSRMGAAVDVPRLARELGAAGPAATILDLSLPESGRDLHWILAQQLFATKRPKLLVLGVIEQPARTGHPGFKYLAPARDVVEPAYFGNINYLPNLIYLPYRQIVLASASLLPGLFDLAPAYDPRRPAIDDAAQLWKSPEVRSRAWLSNRTQLYERGVTPPRLGRRFADEEFGNERAYVARIAEAARVHGTRIAFLFLPYYAGPTSLQERAFYEQFGPVLDASFVAPHDDWYYNQAHLNERGSSAVTHWLAPRIAALLPG